MGGFRIGFAQDVPVLDSVSEMPGAVKGISFYGDRTAAVKVENIFMGVPDFASHAAVAASGLRLAESMILVPIIRHHQIRTAVANGFLEAPG
jgi:non-ribosomal peptide synthetase component E (peptide arylation enzyme)